VKRLILVRHAKASKDDPRLRDRDRPLNERGVADAAEMGRRLARRGVSPAALVTSPAVRALDTARLVARELDFPWAAIAADRRIYEADPADLLEVVRGADGAVECLMLVGHNPGISELAQLLGRGFAESLPTAAVLALDFPADTWRGVRPGAGSVVFFDSPKGRS
jgi:phosphohistidine phosphatase